MALKQVSFKTKALSVICTGCIAFSGYIFSQRSLNNLNEVDTRLKQLSECALKITPTDFVVVDGMRSAEEHAFNLKKGVSWIKRSRHQDGCAIDIAAYHKGKISYDTGLYYGIIGSYYFCSDKLSIPITSGGEWKVQDLMHIELPRSICP